MLIMDRWCQDRCPVLEEAKTPYHWNSPGFSWNEEEEGATKQNRLYSWTYHPTCFKQKSHSHFYKQTMWVKCPSECIALCLGCYGWMKVHLITSWLNEPSFNWITYQATECIYWVVIVYRCLPLKGATHHHDNFQLSSMAILYKILK